MVTQSELMRPLTLKILGASQHLIFVAQSAINPFALTVQVVMRQRTSSI